MGAGCSKRAPEPIAKAMFAAADKDGSGSIDLNEFRKHITPCGNWPEVEQDRVFAKADLDGDGKLSAEEIAKRFKINTDTWPGLADSMWNSADMQKFMSCFDSDGDGVISPEEWAKWRRLLDKDSDGRVSSEELAKAPLVAQQRGFAHQLMQAGDASSDGALDMAEFGKAMASICEGLSEARVSTLAKIADKDGDGKVSDAELRTWVALLDADGDGKISENELLQHAPSAAAQVASTMLSYAPYLADLAPAEYKNTSTALLAVCKLSSVWLQGGSVAKEAMTLVQKLVQKQGGRALLTHLSKRLAQGAATRPMPEHQVPSSTQSPSSGSSAPQAPSNTGPTPICLSKLITGPTPICLSRPNRGPTPICLSKPNKGPDAYLLKQTQQRPDAYLLKQTQ